MSVDWSSQTVMIEIYFRKFVKFPPKKPKPREKNPIGKLAREARDRIKILKITCAYFNV